ncbi:GAF domain-containing protein [Petroclostridium sp. X23]|uniref:sensor histidine kinase n=1 Tax=Petroclostridium sp. X23 TaxID=3045146 RepID=UPI0024AE472C|nr:GAF domain-containing protein [Petroclostridium sp. X23]WHH57889.1 GAF domain-containing protein [Petroclostridium sp. X23]
MSLSEVSELNRVNEKLKREIAERRKAEEQLEKHNHLLSTLLDVSNLVSSTLELRLLLEAILDRLKTILDYKGAKIFALEGEILKVVAHRSFLTEDQEKKYSAHYKHIPLGKQLIVDKQPIVISDVQSDTQSAIEFRENITGLLGDALAYIRSWIGIPLIIKDRVIGLLTIDHNISGYYLPKHLEIGMTFANQAAIEFENARLYNETLKQADELKTMLAVQQAITSRLELDAVMKLIADEARRLTASERTAVFMVEGSDLILSVASGQDTKRFLDYRMPIKQSILGQVLIHGKPMTVNDAQSDPVVYPGLVMKAEVRSFLCVPLTAGSRHIGIIAAADKTTGNFDSGDERILSMLASAAVIGLENARMYQEERQRHLEDKQRRRVAEGLRDILTILNSNRPLVEILDYIVNQAARLMDTDTGALYRLHKENSILTIQAACGLPEQYVKQMDVPVGMGVVGRAVMERKPIDVADMKGYIPTDFSHDTRRKPHLTWLENNYRGLLAIPLLCKEEIYGGIVLYFQDIRVLTKEEIDLAMTFADQAALAIDNAMLRAQAEEMAVAAERSRLARDLHDAVTQTLFSASLIAEVLPKIWNKNADEGKKRLEELRQLARGALAEMRTLLLELRPATLVEAKLEELLKHLAEATTGHARIPVTLTIEGQFDPPTDVKIAFYRIAQEALNNIAKHSEANQAIVTLKGDWDADEDCNVMKLTISDDGYGFNPNDVSGEHLGLGIMQERAEAIGAQLRIDSEIGRGTKIVIYWDLNGGKVDE